MSSGTAPQPYQPPNQALSASQAQGASGSLGQLGAYGQNTLIPGLQSVYGNLANNPYYGQYQAGMGSTGQLGIGFGAGEVAQGQGLEALGNQYQSYIPGVMATAYDPQNALYNQQRTAQGDQTNAILAQQGLGGSPFAAGVGAQAGTNFNLDWQNNQQQRQIAGLGAAQGLGQLDASLQTAGGDLGAAGLNTMYQGYAAPYQAFVGNQQTLDQALAAIGQGLGTTGNLYGQESGSALGYLGVGQEAAQNALNSWKAQQQADQSFWGGIGSLVGDVAGIGLAPFTGGMSLGFMGGGGGGYNPFAPGM